MKDYATFIIYYLFFYCMLTTTQSAMPIYEPAEDSLLLERYVKEYAFGRVLDMGTGSGILALAAMRNPNVREVVAADINSEAVEQLREKVKRERIRKVTVIKSDLFANVEGCFNLVVCNPPYLPQDVIEGSDGKNKRVIEDAALYGGKKGWEFSSRFFQEVGKYLFPEGVVLFLFSSLTNKAKIEEILRNNMLEWRELERTKVSFEELYVYEIKKSLLLRELEKKAIGDIHYFAKGKRGFIYRGKRDLSVRVKKQLPLQKKFQEVAIKVKNVESLVEGSIENEGLWLERLNEERIGPQLICCGIVDERAYVVYQFVEGLEIIDWIEHKDVDRGIIQKVLQDVLEQCFRMDQMGINKEEMHHPHKHILVTERNQAFLIDFERTRIVAKPQNVTQFVEFVCRIQEKLAKKGITVIVETLRKLAQEYKNEPTLEAYHRINESLVQE